MAQIIGNCHGCPTLLREGDDIIIDTTKGDDGKRLLWHTKCAPEELREDASKQTIDLRSP